MTLQSVQQKVLRLRLPTSPRARSAQLKLIARARPITPPLEYDPDAIWRASQELAAQLARRATKVSEIEIDFSGEVKPIGIVDMADLHLGSAGTDYNAIERDAEIIANTDGLYCVVGGDNLDNFIQAFLLTGMGQQVVTASTQWTLFKRYLGIIQHKVLYAAVGNHDDWTRKTAQVDQFGQLVSEFGILDVGYIGVAHVRVGRQHYVAERTHKFWGKSKMNVFLTCTRLLDYGVAADPDILIVEHEHVPAGGWFFRRGKMRYAIRPGTYKVLDDYAAEHHFYGARVAPSGIIYWSNERRLHLIHGVPEMASYLTYLRT